NQIAFVVVESPTSTLGENDHWSVKVLKHVSVTPNSGNVFSDPSTFDEIMQQQRHISHLAWSPWVFKDGWYQSVLVYATNDGVRARVVTYTRDTIDLGEEIVYPMANVRYRGPMKWSPWVEHDKLKLATFTICGLACFTISATDAT